MIMPASPCIRGIFLSISCDGWRSASLDLFTSKSPIVSVFLVKIYESSNCDAFSDNFIHQLSYIYRMIIQILLDDAMIVSIRGHSHLRRAMNFPPLRSHSPNCKDGPCFLHMEMGSSLPSTYASARQATMDYSLNYRLRQPGLLSSIHLPSSYPSWLQAFPQYNGRSNHLHSFFIALNTRPTVGLPPLCRRTQWCGEPRSPRLHFLRRWWRYCPRARLDWHTNI
ncbi:hypothetical protein K438DRAFT_548434 [Mycena galopus ATCC 62051]|nr:hypothetical protein K438DRAFT_548434 [Mycena galopus ATCC 62051]